MSLTSADRGLYGPRRAAGRLCLSENMPGPFSGSQVVLHPEKGGTMQFTLPCGRSGREGERGGCFKRACRKGGRVCGRCTCFCMRARCMADIRLDGMDV